ncbi:hypothetical protein [Croceibacter atlanticus]|jgi:hypothetical protein|uniref:hypothetical protein n=1 Tax=Croceibacter atlanticus TaxID=313588 RepID=UPI0030F8851C
MSVLELPILPFVQEKIDQNEKAYSLDYKVKPNFVNTGEGNALINGVRIKPFESFEAGSSGVVSTGTVTVIFEDNRSKNEVICFYNQYTPIGCK